METISSHITSPSPSAKTSSFGQSKFTCPELVEGSKYLENTFPRGTAISIPTSSSPTCSQLLSSLLFFVKNPNILFIWRNAPSISAQRR